MDDTGHLLIPLYHGTSTTFLSSIQESGLGARDPLRDLDATTMLDQLWDHCEARYRRVAWWDNFRAKSMELRRRSDQLYQYGHLYLTPSPHTARQYASRPYGEFLSHMVELITWLDGEDHAMCMKLVPEDHPLRDLLPGKPVVIQIKRIHVSDLRSEGGGDALPKLRLMERRGNTFGVDLSRPYPDIWQQDNFRLCAVLKQSRWSILNM